MDDKKKRMVKDKKENRIHCNQDKENCYIDIGDLIEITTKEDVNNIYKGEVMDFGLRIQNGTEYDGIHPCITLGILPKDKNGYSDLAMFWTENIVKIQVLRLGG